MSTNLIYSIASLNSLILLLFFHTLSRGFIKFFKLTFSKNFYFIFIIFLIIFFISLICQFILIFDNDFFNTNKKEIRFIILSIIYINLVYNLTIIKKSQISTIVSFANKRFYIFIYLIVFLILSLGIVNDGDSITYHSKISKIVLSGFPVNYFYDNPHYLLIGTFEIFNIIPEILGISNFNTLLNFYTILFFIKFIYEKFEKKNLNTDLFLLLIISTPVISIILSAQKSFFVPLIVQFLSFFYIYYSKKFVKIENVVIISALILTTTFKLNFILTALPIYLCFYIKNKNIEIIKYTLKISLIIFISLIIPHLIFKTVFFETPFPPILNSFLSSNPLNNFYDTFSNELKEWRRNSITFPLNLIINYYNSSFSSIHNSLGVGLLIFLFVKKFKQEKFKLILFCLISILILNITLVQQTSRFYFLPYMISLIIILESKLYKKDLLKKIIFTQFIFTFLVICFLSTISILTTFFDTHENTYKNKLIFRYAAYNKINEITGGKKFIITDLPNYYSSDYEISTMLLRYISNENELDRYKNYINENNVSYFFSINSPLDQKKYINRDGKLNKNFFLKCFKNYQQKFSLPAANRKNLIIKSNKQITYYVYKKEKNCKF